MFGAWSYVGSAASPCIKHFLVMKADFHWFWSVNTNRPRRRASRYVRGPVFCEVYMLQLEQLRCWTTDGVLGVHQEIAICDTKGVVPFDKPCAPWNLRVQEDIVHTPGLRWKQYLRAAAT